MFAILEADGSIVKNMWEHHRVNAVSMYQSRQYNLLIETGVMAKIRNVVVPLPLPPTAQFDSLHVCISAQAALGPQCAMMLMLCEKATEIGSKGEQHVAL